MTDTQQAEEAIQVLIQDTVSREQIWHEYQPGVFVTSFQKWELWLWAASNHLYLRIPAKVGSSSQLQASRATIGTLCRRVEEQVKTPPPKLEDFFDEVLHPPTPPEVQQGIRQFMKDIQQPGELGGGSLMTVSPDPEPTSTWWTRLLCWLLGHQPGGKCYTGPPSKSYQMDTNDYRVCIHCGRRIYEEGDPDV